MEEVMIKSSLSGSFEVTLPAICPCCLAPVSDPAEAINFSVSSEDYAPTGAHLAHQLKVPYCRACQKHVYASQGSGSDRIVAWSLAVLFGWIPLLALAGMTLGPLGVLLGAAVLVVPTVRVIGWFCPKPPEPGSLEGHASVETWAVAISCRSVGNEVRFKFDSSEYAAAFRLANADKLSR